jgi:hypothetical protein
MVLYHNGAKVGTESISRNVGLGQLWVAGGSGSQNQYMTGNLYETRLYYTAFSESEAQVLTETMQ